MITLSAERIGAGERLSKSIAQSAQPWYLTNNQSIAEIRRVSVNEASGLRIDRRGTAMLYGVMTSVTPELGRLWGPGGSRRCHGRRRMWASNG